MMTTSQLKEPEKNVSVPPQYHTAAFQSQKLCLIPYLQSPVLGSVASLKVGDIHQAMKLADPRSVP
jgi:hypothetical protein